MGRRDYESRRDEGGAAAQPRLHGVQILVDWGGGLGIVALVAIAAVGVFCAVAVDCLSKFRRGEPRMCCWIGQIGAADDVRLGHRIVLCLGIQYSIVVIRQNDRIGRGPSWHIIPAITVD